MYIGMPLNWFLQAVHNLATSTQINKYSVYQHPRNFPHVRFQSVSTT